MNDQEYVFRWIRRFLVWWLPLLILVAIVIAVVINQHKEQVKVQHTVKQWTACIERGYSFEECNRRYP